MLHFFKFSITRAQSILSYHLYKCQEFIDHDYNQFGADLWAIRPCLFSRSARKDSRRFIKGVTDKKTVLFPYIPIPIPTW